MKKVMLTIALTMTASIVRAAKPKTAPKPQLQFDASKSELIRSAQIAKNAGADIPDSIGFSFNSEGMGGQPPINGGMTGNGPNGMKRPMGDKPANGQTHPKGPRRGGMGGKKSGEYIIDLDMEIYINRCGFHAVEFFNVHHPDPHMPEQFDQDDGLFKFENRMK